MQVCISAMYMPVGICKLGLSEFKFPEQSQLFLRYKAQGRGVCTDSLMTQELKHLLQSWRWDTSPQLPKLLQHRRKSKAGGGGERERSLIVQP